jgi:hypothetical protein
MDPLIFLDYPLDKERLLKDAIEAKKNSKPYTDSRYPDLYMEDWLIGHYNSEYITRIMNDFNIEGKPRYYWMKPHAVIPEHVDNGTQCSLNFVLTDNASPITIDNREYYYTAILLNTTVPHSVINNEYERIMLKISIFNESYEDLAKRIKYRYDQNRNI